MAHQKTFNLGLDRLYRKRTGWLRTVLTLANPGPVPTLNKKQRERSIKVLQSVASNALARKLAKKEFKHSIENKKTWRTKGRGQEAKRSEFRAWARRKISRKSGKVYVFWRDNTCRYVGRTQGRGTRPSQHFRKSWFNGTTRVDVYMTPRRADIPKLECLAVHRFLPSQNLVKASKEKWTPNCPLCALNKNIKRELRRIYRFR